MVGRTILHYEILEKLGEGGMGVVYKARDRKLDRIVALKFVTPLLAGSHSAEMRFLKEARAISALNHPNIATIFDVVEAEGEVFLVLEYLPGPTLRSRVRDLAAANQSLSLVQALVCVWQMAQALAHAHRRGIIHRDVKPDNAMFTAEGGLKLTDFGLAKLLGAAQLTRSGSRIGTAFYMSPEQATGEDIDQRSDVFSLGIVLYELVAGSPPFYSDNAEGVIYQILHVAPRPIRQARPDLPAALEPVVNRALEKDRERRYPSMDAMADDLRSLVRSLDPDSLVEPLAVSPFGSTPPSSPARPLPATTQTYFPDASRGTHETILPRRRSIWLAITLTGLVSLAAAGLWFTRDRWTVPKGSLLLVAAIENNTSQAEFAAVTDLLRSQLSQSAYFNLVDDSSLKELYERMVRPPGQKLDLPTAREAAWRGRIPLLLSGRLDLIGTNYLLSLQLEVTGDQPGAPRLSSSHTFPASDKNALFDAIREASTWVRRTAGEAAGDVAERDLPVTQTTTSSWEALKLHSQAEERSAQDQNEDAIILFQEAVKIDPDFALAHMRLGDILVGLRRYAEGYDHWRKAVAASSRRTLSKREELRIKALYALDTGDYRSAEQSFRTYSLYFPTDYYPHFAHGMTLEWLLRVEEAIKEYEEAERLNPASYHMPAHLAMAHFALDQFSSGVPYIARLREQGQHQWAIFLEGLSGFLQGDHAAAMERFASLTRSESLYWQSRSFSLRACLLAETGRPREALKVLEEGVGFDRDKGRTVALADKILLEASLRHTMKEFAAARDACWRAFQIESSPRRARRAAALLARSGFPQDAEKLLSRYPRGNEYVFRVGRHHIQGEILLARREVAKSLEELRKADALEAPANHREYLARALEIAGDREAALAQYRKVVDVGPYIWHSPEEDFAGLWAGALFEYARLAFVLEKREDFTWAINRFLALATQAGPGDERAAAARRMLEEGRRRQFIR